MPALSADLPAFLAGAYRTSGGSANLLFYTDQQAGAPSPFAVTAMQKHLHGAYDELEDNHAFIQWLFPLREGNGMNNRAQKLNAHEIAALVVDEAAMGRFRQSYALMLDFYGLRLVDATTGQLARSLTLGPAAGAWRVRYANLSSSSHNYLRITRILKSLSEFGCERWSAGFLLWFLVEQSRGELVQPTLVRSMDGYWRHCLRNEAEREWIGQTIAAVRAGDEFREGLYIAALQRRAATGSFEE